MRKYFLLMRYELKTIVRDPFQLYLCAYPFLLLLLSTLVFPRILDAISQNEAALRYTTLVLTMLLLTMGTFLAGAMGCFLLLEHKDEKTIHTIAVTPVGVFGYLVFKMTYIYLLSAVSSVIVLLGTKLLAADQYIIGGVSLFDKIDIGHIISYALVSSLFAPALALFLGAFAKNKVEGFAFIKGSGMAAMAPFLMILDTFRDGLQYALGIFPNFWSIKGLMQELSPVKSTANLSYPMYLAIGAVYSIAVSLVCCRLFLKKAQY